MSKPLQLLFILELIPVGFTVWFGFMGLVGSRMERTPHRRHAFRYGFLRQSAIFAVVSVVVAVGWAAFNWL
ncbi:MAG: hypothetical protein GC129_00365 [Proteobacteria bacterium]|nr:hypothetical protein [Pseudomonadota bacterium]